MKNRVHIRGMFPISISINIILNNSIFDFADVSPLILGKIENGMQLYLRPDMESRNIRFTSLRDTISDIEMHSLVVVELYASNRKRCTKVMLNANGCDQFCI